MSITIQSIYDSAGHLPFQHTHRSHPLFAPCWSKLLGASPDPTTLSFEQLQELQESLLGSVASSLGTKKYNKLLLDMKQRISEKKKSPIVQPDITSLPYLSS